MSRYDMPRRAISKAEDTLSSVIMLHITLLAVKNMLVSTIPAILAYNSQLNALLFITLAILYVNLIYQNRKGLSRIKKSVFLILIFCLAFIAVTFVLDKSRFLGQQYTSKYVRSQFETFIVYSLPLFLCMSSVKDYDLLLQKFYKSIVPLFIAATVCFVFLTLNISSKRLDYSMPYGNAVMWLSMVLIAYYFQSHDNKGLILFIASTAYIVVYGSRGPLLSIGLTFILYLLFSKKRNLTSVLMIFIFGASFIAIIFGREQIASIINSILTAHGLRSRTLVFLSSGIFTYDSGRSVYFEGVLNALSNHPLIGLGAFGGEKTVGLTHNLYIDTVANFGYFWGSIVLITIIYISIKKMKLYRKTSRGTILFILFMIVFPRGMFAGSFWASKELWMILGILCAKENEILYSKEIPRENVTLVSIPGNAKTSQM